MEAGGVPVSGAAPPRGAFPAVPRLLSPGRCVAFEGPAEPAFAAFAAFAAGADASFILRTVKGALEAGVSFLAGFTEALDALTAPLAGVVKFLPDLTAFCATVPWDLTAAGADFFPDPAEIEGAGAAAFLDAAGTFVPAFFTLVDLAGGVEAAADFRTGFAGAAFGRGLAADFFTGTAETLAAGFVVSVLFDFALTAALPAGDFPFAFGCMLRSAF